MSGIESERRGRPPTPSVTDTGPDGPGRVHRVGWMLRANRLHGPSRELANADTFARAFHGGCATRHADRAQISRWEKGADPASHLVVRRYEQLLELSPSSLTAMADTVYREIHHGGGKVVMQRPVPSRAATEDQLARVLASETVSALEWDVVTAGLAAWPARRVERHIDAVAQRLLAELLIADGSGWFLRCEALSRLLRAPACAPAVIAASGALAADSMNQVFNDPLTILEASPHRLAARHVLATVVSPANERARQAGWWAAAEKITRGHFTSDDKRVLAQQAIELLVEDSHTGARVAAAGLLRLTSSIPSSLDHALQLALDRDEAARSVYGTGRISRSHNNLVRQIAHAAANGVPGHTPGEDVMLSALTDEMLFHPHFSRRVIAAQMIAATPYRPAAGAALTVALRQRAVHANVRLATAMIQALMAVGDTTSRRLVERYALGSEVAPGVREAALWSVAHIPGTGSQAFWTQLRNPHMSWDRPADQLRAIAYAAGVAHQDDVLRRLRRDPRVPHAGRAAAAWWLNHPQYIRAASGTPGDAEVSSTSEP